MKKSLELLSPAGGPKSLKLAVYSGSDAVYLGLSKFSARAKAENFSEENLRESVRFAHLYGVKVYVAINTLVKESEIPEFLRLVEIAAKAGADAFIVQSLALGKFIKQVYPEAVLHASTQMGIHNRYGALICKEAGFSRVILARECSIEDINDIKDNVDIELEAFIHGALCVSFSGGCYMSSYISCTSGNRGQCLQPCRMLYTAYEGNIRLKSGYSLSLADLCVGNDITKLAEAGVTSFKIEGRLRRGAYAAAAAAYYRKILDGKTVTKEDFYNLSVMYNRGGFTRGYYFKDSNINSPYVQGHLGVKTGNVIKVEKDAIIVKSERELHEKDGFKLISGTEEKGGAVFESKLSNGNYRLKYSGAADLNTGVYITTDFAVNSYFENISYKLPFDIKFTAKTGFAPEITLSSKGYSVNVKSDYVVNAAEKIQTTEKDITDKLTKLGDTVFYAEKIELHCGENIFIPASVLNNLRRAAITELENEILKGCEKPIIKSDLIMHGTMQSTMQLKEPEKSKTACITDNGDILKYCMNIYALIYKPNNYTAEEFDIFFKKYNEYKDICKNLHLYIPPLCNKDDLIIIRNLIIKYGIKGVYINNVSEIKFAQENSLKIFMGTGMNIFNNTEITFAESICGDYAISQELSLSEIYSLNAQKNRFIFAYGNISLMTLAHCIVKTVKGCSCADCGYNNNLRLRDRTNSDFFIKRYKISKCYFNIVNGKKLNIFKKAVNCDNYIVDLCGESGENAQALLGCIKNKCAYGNTGEFTSGHIYRCVK